MEAIAIQCANKDCRIAEDDKCVEGLTRDVCPNFGKPPMLTSTEIEEAEDDVWHLSKAGRLDIPEAIPVLRRSATTVVAILGPHDAGKTSLIAGLFEQFQRGPIEDFQFAGSRTLHAFEIACHESRAASERHEPDSSRTPLGEVQFFHIDITRSGEDVRLALLIGDRAGEEYRTAANDTQSVAGFHELRRAQTLTLLVDGNRLVNPILRHQARNEVLRIAQAVVDGGGTTGRQRMAVTLTKLDEVKDAAHEQRVRDDFRSLLTQLQANFASHFSAIQAFEVAASPKKDTVPAGTGLPALLSYWMQGSPAVPSVLAKPARSERIFRRLGVE